LHQIQAIHRYIKTSHKGLPAFLAGDMNAVHSDPALKHLLSDVQPAYTSISLRLAGQPIPTAGPPNKYSAGRTPAQIDHILIAPGSRREVRPMVITRVFEGVSNHGAMASDHFGLLAEIEIEKAAD
jgi:endonuclease/exonuclease/phosphatase family metal-dependent hydrolase